MYLITVSFQAARSRKCPDKPGKIYLSLRERSAGADDGTVITVRDINTGIEAVDKNRISEHYAEIVPFLYTAYRAIESLRKGGGKFTIDDVAKAVRIKIDSGDMAAVRLDDGFVWSTEVASLKKEFRKFFRVSKLRKSPIARSGSADSQRSLLSFLDLMAESSLDEEKESSAASYASTLSSLKRFLNGEDVGMEIVDRTFLESYSSWLENEGVSASTQSFYLRTLRMALNHAASRGLVHPGKGLFLGMNTKVRYERRREESVDGNSLRKISEIDLSCDANLALARDLFMFGFYCRGMELSDIINLTRKNLCDGTLTYLKRGSGTVQTVPLDSEALAIVRRYGHASDTYLFPVKKADDIRLEKSLKNKIGLWLNDLAGLIGLPALTFNMNIIAWQTMVAQLSPSAILGKR